MDAEEKFVSITSLVCEPVRAKMLWSLLDGKAYTASELATAADISSTSASNHLGKLLEADLLKVEVQGRHRYYAFSRPEVAYAIESLANLATDHKEQRKQQVPAKSGVKFCRSCYDHLAGYVGVAVTDALEDSGYIRKTGALYTITKNGWQWLDVLNVHPQDVAHPRRPAARQCLDWSERRPHIAGVLGQVLLERMLEQKWFRRVQFSRELIVTPKGRSEMQQLLRIDL